MPTYDYRCEVNGEVVEVKHRMNESLTTWGEVCNRIGIELGGTSPDAPVKRLATGGQVVKSSSLGSKNAPACSTGPCCGGGVCGLS